MDSTKCIDPTFNKYYKIVNTDDNKNYLFVGSYDGECDSIFKKLNLKNDITKSEELIIEKYYGKSILNDYKDCIFITNFISEDDSIKLIKKKIMIYLDTEDPSSLHLYAERTKLSELEVISIKNRLLDLHYLETYKFLKERYRNITFRSTIKDSEKISKKNISSIDIVKIIDTLGISYSNSIGKKIIGYDLYNFDSTYDKQFDDNLYDDSHKPISMYEEFLSEEKNKPKFDVKTIYLATYDFFIKNSTEENRFKITQLYFPFKKSSIVNKESYKTLINQYDSIINEYKKLSYLRNHDTFHEIQNCKLTNTVLCFDKKFNVNCSEIFDNLNCSDYIKFIHYKDSSNQHFYKVDRKSISISMNKNYRKDFKNPNDYLVKYKTNNEDKISKSTLESWKYNKYTTREKMYLKTFFDSKRQNFDEVSIKIKLQDIYEKLYSKKKYKRTKSKRQPTNILKKTIKKDKQKKILEMSCDYVTVTINSFGLIFVKLLNDIAIDKKELNEILKQSIKQINLIGNLTSNPFKIQNLNIDSNSINFISFDSNNSFKIPLDKNLKISRFETIAKRFYPYIYLTKTKDSKNILNLKYKKIENIETEENYKKYFIKLKKSTKLTPSEFKELWLLQAQNIFNLSNTEASSELSRITEEIKEEDLRKNFIDNEINIEIIRENPDVLKKLDIYSINVTNCKSLNNLYTVIEFINTLFYKSLLKDQKKETKIEVSELKVIDTPKSYLIEEEDIDFDDDFIDSDDEEDNDNNTSKQIIEPAKNIINNTPSDNDIETPEEYERDITSMTLRKYMSEKVRKKYDLILHDTTSTKEGFKGYATSCGTSDMRQPIIINKLEYESFKEKNPEGFKESSIVRYGSSPDNLNYYVCARIWCIKDKVALTAKQFIENNGKCIFCNGGIIDSQTKMIGKENTLIIKRGGSNNYWMDTNPKDSYKKTDLWKKFLLKTEKDPYVGFLDKKNHPNGLCMPCCFSREVKGYGSCLETEVDIASKENISLSSIKTGLTIDSFQLQSGSRILLKNQSNKEENNIYVIDKNNNLTVAKDLSHLFLELQNNMQINVLHGTQSKYSWIAKSADINKNSFNFIKGESNIQYDEKYIIGKDKIPYINKHGILPDIVDKLFKNNINDKLKKSRLIQGQEAFLRKGIRQIDTNSFICSMSNYYQLSNEDLISLVIKKIDPLLFIKLNNGDLLKIFSINKYSLDNNKDNYIKWCNTYKNIIKFLDIDDILNTKDKKTKILINIFYAFENFKMYLGDFNIRKNLNHLWHLFSIKTEWLNPDGLNILILEKTIENDTEKVRVLCPSNGNPQLLYTNDAPIYILLKTNEMFEPIIYTKSDKKIKEYESLEINSDNLEEKSIKIINDLLDIFNSQCVEILNDFVIGKNKEIKYEELMTFKEVEQIVGSENINYQLITSHLNGVGVLLKNNLIIHTKPYSINESSKYIFIANLDDKILLKYSEIVEEYDILKTKNIKPNLYRTIVKNNNVIGILTDSGTFIPCEKEVYDNTIHKLEPINLNFNVMHNNLFIDNKNNTRVTSIKQEQYNKKLYENLRSEISNLFSQKNKNIDILKNFITKIIINPVNKIGKKRQLINPIINKIIKSITVEKSDEIINQDKPFKTCQEISKNKKCGNKCIFDKKQKITLNLDKDITLFIKPCKLQIKNVDKFANAITEEILRFPIKRNELLDEGTTKHKYNIKNDLVLDENNYNDVINNIYDQNENIFINQKLTHSIINPIGFDGITNTIGKRFINSLSEKETKKIPRLKITKKKKSNKTNNLIETNYQKIFAKTIAKNGEDLTGRGNFKEGYCVPFYYKDGNKRVLLNKCILDKDKSKHERGTMCATSVYEDSDNIDKNIIGYPKTWGFCESEEKANNSSKNNKKTKKIIKSTSILPQGRHHDELIEKGDIKKGDDQECVFPFRKNKNKTSQIVNLEDGCEKGKKEKDPNWCATEVDKDKVYKTYAYCKDDRYSDIKNKFQSGEFKERKRKKTLIIRKKSKPANNTQKKNKIVMFSTSVLPQSDPGQHHRLIINKKKQMKEGENQECIFPFKYGKKEYNECIEGKKEADPNWCPTELGDDGRFKTYAYCKDDKYYDIQEKFKTGKLSKKKSIKIKKVSWIGKYLSDSDFKIVETLKNGDCFFDSIRLAINKTVKEQRDILSSNVNQKVFDLFKTVYKNAKKDKDSDVMEEFNFMDSVNDVSELKDYVLLPEFWANSWAIGVIEKHYNIKVVIFSEESYNRENFDNVIQCGDMELSEKEPICKICEMTKTKYDNTKNNPHAETFGNHIWEDEEEIKEIEPNKYIILTYSGDHYRLIKYKNTKSFDKLPQAVRGKIIEKCSKNGKLLGIYGRIKNF